MLGLLVKLALSLTVLAVALVGVAQSLPPADDTVGTLILPATDCVNACWNGIEIGRTTRQEAVEILTASPWVERTFETSMTVTWRWNGTQPPEINGTRDGVLQIGNNLVRQIRIQTRIPLGEVWLLLDRPDYVRLVQPLTRSSSYQIASYDVGIQVISTLGCSITPERFWTSPITLGMGDIWSTEALNGRGFDIYHTSSWWDRLRFC